ncbi:MAG: ClpXP protease specificity-enhancing factor SspB [Alphaproteobacteria bacterium]|nr:ClpXP protease specificity-enhancing factor SspB [Alphaproteobacteria bacterium]
MSDYICYGELIEQSMLDVVRKILKKVSEEGLPSEHHFYITFLTDHKDVEIDEELKQKNPYDMTIVLQNQFWNLKVQKEKFSLELNFNGVRKKIVVPFDALLAFNDPSVQFSLHFNMKINAEDNPDEVQETKAKSQKSKKSKKTKKEDETEIVNISDFKKNKKGDKDE